MIWDEAVAAVELDEQFWAEFLTSETKFLWWPQYNYLTGRRMWLCKAVRATSGVQWPDLEKHGLSFTTTRWYKPKDFVTEYLKRT